MVAIKHVQASFKEEEHYVLKKVLREIQILRHLTEMKENVHTVKILDLIVSEDMTHIFIVMNHLESDLKKVLSQDVIGFTEKHTITILFRLLSSLNFLHKANVMHRDLKPGNVLMDNDCNLMLCDFGLARTSYKVESQKKKYSREAMSKKLMELRSSRQLRRRSLSNHVITRAYRPPEVIILEPKYR